MADHERETETPTKPWQWPRQWARDEAFWRDVSSRGLAGLIVVLIGYVFAASAGYISTPGGLKIFFYVLTGVGGFAVTALAGRMWASWFSPVLNKQWGDWRDFPWILVTVSISFVPVAAGFFGFSLLIGWINNA